MNYKLLGRILGKIMIMEGVLMTLPLIVSFIYKEPIQNKIAFVVPIALLVLLGGLMQIPQPKRTSLYQKEGFAIVGLVWIIMTLFGAIPFIINKEIPNYIDACFEMMSGFTTTGASIVNDVTALSRSSQFWRTFSHWIGGMGILVFVLIFIPESNDGSSMHLLRAESPGPKVGKIASKMKVTARILYLIYFCLTVAEILVLLCDKNMLPEPYAKDRVFYSILASLGSAGTGGFGFVPNSIELFSPFTQYAISIFLLLFGCNFALYYLILLGKIKEVFRSEEFRAYGIMLISSITIIFVSLYTKMQDIYSIEEAFRHSLFQVASIITTTGYSTTNFNMWPEVAKTVLVILMFSGAMAGSTAGGMKISRIVMAIKGSYVNVRKLINPRYVPKAKFEGKSLEEKTTNDVFSFFALYLFVLLLTTLLLSFDTHNVEYLIQSDLGVDAGSRGFFSNFSAALSCISNIGPGFDAVGPYSSFANYSYFSKLLLTLVMLMGRLEILPILILFNHRTWKRT